jgi:pyruvate dehydrogenase E2 component (dihydrolipoamide acetyltransferase)
MTRSLAYLDELNKRRDSTGSEPSVTITHLVAKAIAKAIAAYPDTNAIIARRALYRRDSVDVYCQVATDDGEDLSGLKIVAADTKSAIQIADEMRTRVKRVLEHKDPGSERTKSTVAKVPHRLLGIVLRAIEFLTYDLFLDLSRIGVEFDQFGSAMVSNVGSFGIGHGLAPLVPASRVPIVLLVGAVIDRAVVRDSEIVAAPMMTIGATFDHRLIDGYQAGELAHIVVDSLTDPYLAFGVPSRSSSIGDRPVLHRPETTSSDPNDNEYTDHTSESDRSTHPR